MGIRNVGNELNARQSELIKTMRFPLIVLVLYEHSVRIYSAPMTFSMDSANVFHFFTEMFSHFFCPIGVCWFFFFSGFLFYHNLRDGQFNWQWTKRKWVRRFHSVLLPHLFWNLFSVAAILLVTWLFNLLSVTITSDQMEVVRKGPLFWFITGPIDFPLWYLRDLLIMSILAPLMYYPIQKWPWVSLAAILVLYIVSFKVRFFLFPTFSLFSMGVWMSIRKDNVIALCRLIKYPAAIIAFLLLPFATSFYGGHSDYDIFLSRLFFPSGMVTFLNICDALYDNLRYRKLMLELTETVFFIYAVHEIYILGWVKGLFLRVFGQTLAAKWVSYLFVPIITLFICLALFYLLKRFLPKVLSFVCGWRTVHKGSYSK